MVWRWVPPVVELAVCAELSLWRPLSSGLPDRHRTPFVAVFLVVTSQLERTDLLEGDDPANTLEWIIQIANQPTTYVVVLTVLAGLVLAAFVAGGAFGSVVMALLYLG